MSFESTDPRSSKQNETSEPPTMDEMDELDPEARGRKRFETARKVVLLAEDDAELRCLIADALRKDDCMVVELANGQELLDELACLRDAQLWPSLVVSDIRMPGVDGLHVLQQLRAWGCTSPVILITAFAFEGTLTEARAFGAAVIFSKPFDLRDLRIAARCFLRAD
jgi:CheY-like chemotaxis protein